MKKKILKKINDCRETRFAVCVVWNHILFLFFAIKSMNSKSVGNILKWTNWSIGNQAVIYFLQTGNFNSWKSSPTSKWTLFYALKIHSFNFFEASILMTRWKLGIYAAFVEMDSSLHHSLGLVLPFSGLQLQTLVLGSTSGHGSKFQYTWHT